MDFSKDLSTTEIEMFSDSSKNPELGFGGVCGNSWMFDKWDSDFVRDSDPSIAFLELYALVATVLNWISRFKDRRVVLFCDNQSVVQMVNNTTSSCKKLHGLDPDVSID